MSKALVPEAKNGLKTFKTEVARELGVPFSDYNGDLTARQCGSVGGIGNFSERKELCIATRRGGI